MCSTDKGSKNENIITCMSATDYACNSVVFLFSLRLTSCDLTQSTAGGL